jgi:asparagine synthase (glutamine-hydrolysing)
MTVAHHTLTLGSPSFSDTPWASQAAVGGAAAVWQAAAEAGRDVLLDIARLTRGHFAAAGQLPGGRAFMVVDRFAVHTLCFAVRQGGLQFSRRADDPALGGADLDPQALYDYLYFHAIPSPQTVFCGVRRLPPGHIAWFEDGRLEVLPYWKPRFEEPESADFAFLAQAFRDAVQSGVSRALDGTKPACFLSGGTDSSTVAGMIGRVAGRPAATYSIGFDADGYDEMAYARLAAKHFGTDHHEYYVTPEDLVQGIPQLAAHHDQPFGNSSALPAFYCAKVARDDGVELLLAGDGGDELYGGNARYAKQRIFGLYGLVPPPIRGSVLEPALSLPGVGRVGLLRKARSYVEQARVPLPARNEMYNLLLRLGPGNVLTPEFLERVDAQEPLKQQQAVWASADAPSELNRMLAFDWRYTLAENDLPKVRTSVQMAGLRVAFPFLDDAVLDLSLRLPVAYKLKGLKLRWFFKEALRGFLPDDILTKKKHGFGLPFGVWANRHDGLKALATDSLHGLAGRRMVRKDFVETLLRTHLPAHPGYYGEMVWILMMLEQWLRKHAPDSKLA